MATTQPVDPVRNKSDLMQGANQEQLMHPIYRYAFITDAEEGLIATDITTLVDGDPRTNVTLMPDDQVYVGETKQSSLSRLMPDWLGTVYRRVTGLLPDDWWPFGKVL